MLLRLVLAILAALSGAAYAQTGPGPPPNPWNYGPSLSLFYNNGGVTLGSPTGGTEGIGTINVSSGFFVNGAPIGLTVGGSITGSCTNGFGLYNNGGVLGCISLGGSGTVTSVALTVPSYESVSGSPITGAGTLAVSLATQTTNKVFAAPNGSTGVPTFRALVNADLPAIPVTDLTGQVSVANGGTGLGTLTANLPLIGAGTSNVAFGARSGNTTTFATATGTLTSGHCVQFDASGNIIDAGGACTVGGGGGTVTSASINQLAWYNAAGTTVVGLATANNGLLVTSAGGVPSISSTIPAAAQALITGTGTLASGTTASGFNVACASLPAATGDVTAPAGSCAQTVAANAVTYAKFQTVAASSLIGNSSGSTGNAAAITLGATLSFSGAALQTAALSGDITTPANSFVTTLNTVNSNVGTFGSSSLVPVITVNGKGLVTAMTTAAIGACGTLTGDVTSVGCATTLATVNTNVGSFGSSTSIPNFNVNGKGLIVAAGSNVVIAPAGTLSGAALAAGVTSSSLTSLGTLTSLGLSGSIMDVQSIGATSTDGIVLDNNTLAANGAQQWSTRVHWSGQGWKTNVTAGSQSVDVIAELQPVQGAANPTANLVFSDSINAGAYGVLLTLPSGGGLNLNSGTYQIAGAQIAFSNIASTVGCGQLPALTGDITSSGCATTLATVNANTGAFGSSTAVPTITLNAKGLATAATTSPVIAPAGTLTGATLAAGVTASSLTSFGSSPTIASPTVTGALNATGLVTNADLANSSTSVNGTPCTLGSGCTITASATSILEHGGRLTLVAGQPVMVSNNIAQTALYYAPYTSPFVAIYNGTNVINYQFTSSATDAVGLTLGTFGSGWVASTVYDVFVALNSGSPVLCTGPAWSTLNARATAGSIGLYDGQKVNSNASSMTCRISNSATISVPQYQATFVGTIATNTSNQLVWAPQESTCTNAACGPAILYVWNNYNRRIAYAYAFDNTTGAGLSYTSATIRTAAGSTNNRIYYVTGAVEDTCTGYYQSFESVSGGYIIAGFWFNEASTPGATQQYQSNSPIYFASGGSGGAGSAFQGVSTSFFNAACFPVGLNYEEALEQSDGSHANYFGYFGQQVLEFSYPM